MKTNSYQPDMFPSIQPLPESWLGRLSNVVAQVRPCLKSMKPGQSKTIARVSPRLPSVTVIKLSTQANCCQGMALLSADTILLLGTTKLRVLHRGQSYESTVFLQSM